MFKHDKVKEFIEKYGWELANNNFEELEDFLNTIPNFLNIIRKINKLSANDKEYVLSTINNYKKYGFNEEDVTIIINDKLKYIKIKKDTFKYPNFDRLYYAFNKEYDLYNLFLEEYQKPEESNTSITLKSYYDVITNNYVQFNQLMKEFTEKGYSLKIFKKFMYSLTPRCFHSFFEHAKEKNITSSVQFKFFNVLLREDIEFSTLSICDFNDIIEFVFNHNNQLTQEEVLEKKLIMISYFKDEIVKDWNYLNMIDHLPDDYIVGIFKEENVLYDNNFLSLIKESDSDMKKVITNFIADTSSHYNDTYYKVLNSDIFTKISCDTIKTVLTRITKIKDKDEDIKQEEISLIMNCIGLDNQEFISKSLDFIKNDEDIRLISTKINCIKSVISHIYDQDMSINDYSTYLEILDYGLEDMSIDKKIDVLETRTHCIEKENLYKNINRLSEKAIALLDSENNRKECIYNLINHSVNYEKNITELIIERINQLKSTKSKKIYIDFVVDNFFTDSDEHRQNVLLGLYKRNNVKIDFGESNDTTIEVSPYIYNAVSNSDKALEFINKDTGIKIFVKKD